jgi:excisionase family DNA binding protein
MLPTVFPVLSEQSRADLMGTNQMKTPITVTIPDAVKATGLSRSSIYEALKRGDLTARKAGRRTLISLADLEAYLASLPTYQARA